jgi:hypothetical protein
MAVPDNFVASQAASMTLSLRGPLGFFRSRLIAAARRVKNFLT